ncbi:HTH-type transcriptional regulator TreR [Pectobacterium parmentieri]|uniref:trehalose operon repressor TreR n=1 Tax=Pectobacterium parmentieri TaxID=1905730 RepID=UPI000473B595|nr:trehalose operon repressor TreR [Pectobacterium parmentieri]AYH04548.1 HTH-type transcriptional regulator TreR [Pectobacterium parmentieri]AYH13370.1 HTH-type transcriptional regulator TreR [Pectobacterium parmentieri]AYH22072.1 HTH-type transcriptional regulator TreR [Pectobacterium parmentieri]MBN3179157.1 HTH-type transcriptional regulator TreR [Pectobacterium parmentieri]POW29431.1 trehalose operon repressor [Pectobacterium parmentieri]
MNKLTIKDIAALCKVGKSTVSRVLNNDQNVNEVTRQKVLAVIEQYQFTPSKSARAMRGLASRTVGIIVTRLDSYAENQTVRAILPLLHANGIDPIILESQFDPKKVDEHLTMLERRKIDGVILFAFTGLASEQLASWQQRIVIIARSFDGYTCVCNDDTGTVNHLMEFLHQEKKFNQIGYIGIDLQDETTGLLRFKAYENYCQQHRLTINAELGELNFQSGYLLAQKVLSSRPQAILCATDSLAFGVQKYLKTQMINDIFVACIGRNDLLKFLFPETKTCRLGFRESGELSANLLINIINDNFSPKTHIVLSS